MSSQEESFSEKEKPIRTLNVFLSITSRMVCKNGGKFERF